MFMMGLVRLGKDAVVRYTADNKPVMDLSLAFNYGRKTDEKTQWINATMFGDRVEKVSQYLTKGTQLFVTLENPHIEEYTRKDGSNGVSMNARINNIEFCGLKQDTPKEAKPASEKPKTFSELDDDVPF